MVSEEKSSPPKAMSEFSISHDEADSHYSKLDANLREGDEESKMRFGRGDISGAI